MQSKRSLTSKFLVSILLVSIILISVIGVFSITKEYKRFNTESARAIREYIKTQKSIIKSETDKATDYIEHQRNVSAKSLKQTLKLRTYEAYAIAENIYIQNKKTKTESELKKLIIDALRPVRINRGRCYYFIDDMQGRCIMPPVGPCSENKEYIDIQDCEEKFVVHEFIQISKTKREGFLSYYAPTPETDTSIGFEKYEKISYIKYFPPFDWIISTGGYMEGDKSDLQAELIQRVSKISFNETDSLFILTYDGKVLTGNGGFQGEGHNLFIMPFNQIQSNALKQEIEKPEGAFVTNTWECPDKNKNPGETFFIRTIPDWKWVIGARLNYDKINAPIEKEKASLMKRVKKEIIQIIALLISILLIAMLLAKQLAKIIKRDIAIFISFFKDAAQYAKKIDAANLNLPEFEAIAESANSMIDERERIINALHVEEVYLNKLFENSPEGIVLTNKRSIILKTNPAFSKIFGYSPAELAGKYLNKLIPSELYFNEAEKFSSIIAKGKSIAFETVRQTKEGKLIDVSILGIPVNIGNKYIGIYGIYRDISEQKKAEKELIKAKIKAEEADRLKTAFLTNMTHEIRTPMNAIIGFSELLSSEYNTEKERQQCIDFIKNSSNILLHLIDSIIDIAKIETGQITINKSECFVNQSLSDLYLELKNPLFKNRPLDFKLIIGHDDNNFLIQTDTMRLRQILSNLIRNAVKFTEKGFVEFGYKIQGTFLEFYVKDTGIGITKKSQKLIFESFRQLDVSVTRKYEGAGIGLTIAKSLVELMGGEIWLESETGIGTTFFFTIPIN